MTPAEYLKRPYSRVVVPETDGSFRAEILEFPGCIASGDTASEALANLESVAGSWLESVVSRGQSIPEPVEEHEFSGKLVLRLAKSVHQKAAKAARSDGVSLNAFIANCLAEFLGARSAAPAHHYITNYSQHNMVIMGSEGSSMRMARSVSSSGQQATYATSEIAPNVTRNPWNSSHA